MNNAKRDFYLTIRATRPGVSAVSAWTMAEGWTARAAELKAKAEDAKAALAAAWQDCGMIEPKRFSDAGKALAALRTARTETEKAAANVRHAGHVAGEDGPAGALRYVGRVMPEGGRRGTWDNREDCGHYTNQDGESWQDGSGLCYGVVYQLTGRGGLSRFVAGYQFGGVDGGPSLDLKTVYTARVDWDTTAREAAEETKAPAAADAAAKAAAEEESAYQAAWRAGSDWAELKGKESRLRRKALAILAERRAAKGLGDFPALCGAVRANVSGILAKIAAARSKRRKLAAGDVDSCFFYPDDGAKAAFCEGAGLDGFPA